MGNMNEITGSLENILEAVNALPDAGSGGGSMPETCTVAFTEQSGISFFLSYLKYVNNEITPVIINSSYFSYTFENIVCGSIITIYYEVRFTGTNIEGNIEQISDISTGDNNRFLVFLINGDGSITLFDND